MATILIYPDVAHVLHDLLESLLSGEFVSAQLTLTDRRGAPIDLIIQSDEEANDE